ncbi:MAG: hypothetical protein Q8K43_03105 [Sulfurimicrobium sp.]|nr:hypothetical protein [Sulfurimicrobium sp.]MDP1705529.1 hypothetical protein [Sulfurimicrobium sp.]MDP1896855.1 hypothetical protein [Sulfurimicrobium sp.]MDP2197468.1 hypothetical protein [Sulfurimicrobium sp.]MDP2963325.1 hypothetical protein [Sulfurimicrobium sp.]
MALRKIVLIPLLLAAVVLTAVLLRSGDTERKGLPVSGLPWQIDLLPDGNSKVFGLTLTQSTLGDAREHFGPDMEIAVIARREETGSLEAYYGRVTTGVLTGKMILVADLDKESVERMRQHAGKSTYTESSAKKYTLSPEDLALAYSAPIGSITFIPSASLDEETALARFGPPGERIRVSEQVEHLLYPGKGLAITLDKKGKELLQYVAPRNFARLRDPLLSQRKAN